MESSRKENVWFTYPCTTPTLPVAAPPNEDVQKSSLQTDRFRRGHNARAVVTQNDQSFVTINQIMSSSVGIYGVISPREI